MLFFVNIFITFLFIQNLKSFLRREKTANCSNYFNQPHLFFNSRGPYKEKCRVPESSEVLPERYSSFIFGW